MNKDFYVDLHCHPTMKPFGKSFDKKGQSGKNSLNRKLKESVWFYNPPSVLAKLLNQLLSITKFSQSDFSTSTYGNVRVVCASLYPIERSFCRNKLGKSLIADLPVDFVTGFGKNRIDAIQNFNSAAYCTDLQREYAFLKELHGKEVTLTDGRKYTYRLVNSFHQLEAAVQGSDPKVETIAVVVTIEGAHAFGCGIDKNATSESMKESIKTVKDWEFPPFFVTFAHHFYNELCGHAESLSGMMKKLADQSEGLNEGFTPLGEEALRLLLSKANGKRILIDVKHMGEVARNRYYQILENDFQGENIPVIVSHGCVQGNHTDKHKFNTASINLTDRDLLQIAKTDGLFGIQLDERRIASDSLLRYARSFTKRSKVLYHWAELVWNQIQHMAEVLDANGYFAWGNICLGTDFDGIIDPINGYWTHEDMPDLETHLLIHAHNYMKKNPALSPKNKIHEEEIVTRVMGSNAVDFFKNHFA